MLSDIEILALTLLPGMTGGSVRTLVESGVGIGEIIAADPLDLASVGLRRSAREAVGELPRLVEDAGRQYARAAALGARIILYRDDAYPTLLRQIYAPPTVLYGLGTFEECDTEGVAIVGTRGATLYGRLCTERYATACALNGITVVSGLARGIDTFAHQAALDAGGRTIAVVASGIDEIQPAYGARLAEKIAATAGAVISEYPFGVRALRAFFPQRNRIVSGMTRGTLVVESDLKGGAMITAGFALDQNREVFAVPGAINIPASRGTNLLIRTDRARLTQTPEDMLDAMGYELRPPIQPDSNEPPPTDLTAFESSLMDVIDGEPRHIDDICERLGLSTSDALVQLLHLEFRGLVRQLAGKLFVRT